MTIKQYGNAVRVGAPVETPTPQMYDEFDGVVKVKKFTPLAPIPMPDKKTLSFGASWHYEIVVPFADDDIIPTMSGDRYYYDTKAGGDDHPYPLPTNAAVTFDPTTNRQNVDVAVVYDSTNTTTPTIT